MIVADASVLRNFGVLGCGSVLAQVAEGPILVAHGVFGADPSEQGEVERIRNALERISDQNLGSGLGSRALSAVAGLDHLIALRSTHIRVATLTDDEQALALRLQSRDPVDRAWRRDDLQLRARRLDVGEAASIALAVKRGLRLACDEHDGRQAFEALSGNTASRTVDLVRLAVEQELLDAVQAREGYNTLMTDELHRFGGPPWQL